MTKAVSKYPRNAKLRVKYKKSEINYVRYKKFFADIMLINRYQDGFQSGNKSVYAIIRPIFSLNHSKNKTNLRMDVFTTLRAEVLVY